MIILNALRMLAACKPPIPIVDKNVLFLFSPNLFTASTIRWTLVIQGRSVRRVTFPLSRPVVLAIAVIKERQLLLIITDLYAIFIVEQSMVMFIALEVTGPTGILLRVGVRHRSTAESSLKVATCTNL